ncbi:MAG TPA: arsenate reductase ArsC [Methyloceanibacter sp.]|nr:arsenate reductase ArsC [Methyloceanibacter sp.]
MGQAGDLPGAVLFACSRNAVRSPMAEALLKHLAGKRIYVVSAGVRAGEPDPFAAAVMEELGIDMSAHKPKTLAELGDSSFDLIVSLSPEAHHKALALAEGYAIEVEYWPTADPTLTAGNREQILDAYRAVRDGLFRRIKQRFPLGGAGGV